ncbi:MAG: sensor histidine kinase [Eubacteriales bacterium]|nr:sensor histidine kinase [Eubacteriales bacterium]
MKSKYHELSLAKKFSVFSILIIVIAMVIFTVTIRMFFEKSVLEITSEGYKEKFDIASESSQKILEDAEKIAKVLLTDDTIQSWFLEESQDMPRRLNQKIQVEKRLDYLDALYPDNQYSSISVFDSQGNMVNTNQIRTEAAVYQQFFPVIESMQENQEWLDLYRLEIPEYEESGIAYVRYYRDYTSGKIKGYIMIEYRSQLLINNFVHMRYGDTGSYMVTDLQGNVKILNDEDSLLYVGEEEFFQWASREQKGGRVFRMNGERYLVTSDIIPKLNWVMIGITPVEELTRQAQVIIWILYGIGAGAILLSAYFSFRMAHSMTRPLTRLADTMGRFGKGELSAHVPVQYKDEIGMLSEEFNKMAQQIQKLVDQIYREQREKRKSELAALQAQINPHFLYNTLNSVSSMIRMDCPEEACTMMHAISMFYRTSLSDGKTLVPIEQEMTNIENYIQIQKLRYGDKIAYEIEIDPAVKKEWIVKLTLQPLVENAIYHGIKEMHGRGVIKIRGFSREKSVWLQVEDNGVGIPEEKMKGLLTGGGNGRGNSYGLYNVQQRLQIYFGKEYGLTVESIEGSGTTVSVRIPAGFEREELERECISGG